MYKLSTTLVGHEDDVKQVKFCAADRLLSVSRDRSARCWSLAADNSVESLQLLYFTDKYLNSVAKLGATEALCGSQSGAIALLDTSAGSQKNSNPATLSGHSANVCALDTNEGLGLAVSGSWDKTARIWDLHKLSQIALLEGHTQAVWAVKFVSSRQVLTASADSKICLWALDGRLLKTFTGHTDAVRALDIVDADHFVSCANDASVKLWSFHQTTPLRTLNSGHTSFVYSVVSLGGGLVASCGEDRSLRISDTADGALKQVIALPFVSAWSVDATDSSIAVGGSDSNIHIFTKDPAKVAFAQELANFDELVGNFAIGQDQQVSDQNLSDPAVLKKAGTSEGQVVVVKDPVTLKTEAHQWAAGTWIKIGEVVGSAGSSSGKKVAHTDGKSYDYVFDVDIEEGKPALKLPYNKSENPYETARKFVELHELPASYVDQVAQFLITNTGAVNINDAPVSDPYTSRYVPASENERPAEQKSKSYSVLPYNKYVVLAGYKAPALSSAFIKGNASFKTFSQLEEDDVCSALEDGVSDKNAEVVFKAAIRIVPEWGVDNNLIGLDLLRISIPSLRSVPAAAVIQTIFSALDPDLPKHSLLAVRALANLIANDSGRSAATGTSVFEYAVSLIGALIAKSTALEIAGASLLLNYSISALSTGTESDKLMEVLSDTAGFVKDSEAKYRLLLALGNTLVKSPTTVSIARGTQIDTWVRNQRLGEERFKDLCSDVLTALA